MALRGALRRHEEMSFSTSTQTLRKKCLNIVSGDSCWGYHEPSLGNYLPKRKLPGFAAKSSDEKWLYLAKNGYGISAQ